VKILASRPLNREAARDTALLAKNRGILGLRGPTGEPAKRFAIELEFLHRAQQKRDQNASKVRLALTGFPAGHSGTTG
jgi:hypothetical protein